MSVRTLVKSIQGIMRKDAGVDGDAQRISQLCWLFFLKIIDDQDQELELMRDGYESPMPAQFQWRNWAADPEGLTGEALLAFVNDQLFPALKGVKPTGQPGDRRRVVRDVFEDAYNYMKSGQLLRQVVNKINDIDFNNLTERQHFGDVYEQLLNDLQSAGNAGEYYTPRAVTAFMVDRIDPKPGEIIFDPSCGTGGFLTCAMSHMRERYVKRPEDELLMQQSFRAVEKKPLPHRVCLSIGTESSGLLGSNRKSKPLKFRGSSGTIRASGPEAVFRISGRCSTPVPEMGTNSHHEHCNWQRAIMGFAGKLRSGSRDASPGHCWPGRRRRYERHSGQAIRAKPID